MQAQELYALMSARRSCRVYSEKQVPVDLLQQVLEGGRMAPSGKNVQQCHFIVINQQRHLQELRTLVTATFAGMKESDEHANINGSIRMAQEGEYDFFYSAPTLIVVANQQQNPNNIADSAVALQNMMLMATALGLGNCWINQLRWLKDEPELRDFLGQWGLGAEERVYGALALGYEGKKLPDTPLPRKGNIVDFVE